MKLLSIIISACIFAFGSALAGEEPIEFKKEIEKLSQEYGEFFESLNARVMKDEVLEANAALAAKADEIKSPFLDFLIANMLFKLDPENSFRLQKRAREALPKEPYVALEWAMACHRKGDYATAAESYEQFLKANPNSAAFSALLADCYLHTGKIPEAVTAWNNSNHGGNHTQIEELICDIYMGESGKLKRAKLLSEIAKGDNSKFEDLIAQDLYIAEDWWNGRVYVKGLERDLERAKKALDNNSQRYKELVAWAALAQKGEPIEKDIADQLRALNILVEKGTLPENSKVCAFFLGHALNFKLVKSDEILMRFGAELEKRATTGPGDSEALNTLCVLVSGAGDLKRLRELDQLGLERFKEVRYARSILAGMLRDNVLKLDSKEMVQAVTQFPNDQWLWNVRLMLLGKDKITVEELCGAMKAEFRNPGGDVKVEASYKLKGMFAMLENLSAQK